MINDDLKPLPTVSGASGPPDHWSVAVNISRFSSGQVQEILNDQAALGNTTVLYAECLNGKFLFFGNYSRT
jgi:hypothetical protein